MMYDPFPRSKMYLKLVHLSFIHIEDMKSYCVRQIITLMIQVLNALYVLMSERK